MNPLIHLPEIYRHRPCRPGWRALIKGLGVGRKRKGIFVSLGDIATTNDSNDAYWCIQCLDWSDVALRRALISGAVLPTVKRAAAHTDDARVHDCIVAVERWCDGDDSVDLKASARAAWVAAEAADAEAARAAAWAAAWAAVRSAWAAAGAAEGTVDASWHAAGAAEGAVDAAWFAEDASAACDAERERQRQDIIAAFPPVYLSKEGDK